MINGWICLNERAWFETIFITFIKKKKKMVFQSGFDK